MGRNALLGSLIGTVVWASAAFAVDVGISQFKYLNKNDNSLTLDNSEAQDLLNVDIRPGGRSIKKRDGYGTFKDLGTGQGIHGGHHFFDAAGNDVQLWGSSTSLYGIVADGTPTQLVSSATLNATWDCADTQGFAYCVNSSRNALIRTNGETITWLTSPLGTMVETTPDRLIVAGVSGSANTIYFSESGAFTNFTTGLNETSPFTAVIASPGGRITHLRYGCGKILWWKDQSFGYLNGDNQYDISNTIVSDTIGTLDNTSAIDPGGTIWFRSQDGHIYTYDCAGLAKQSINITPLIQASGRRRPNSWTQTTDVDFAAGFSSNTSVLNGSVVVSTDSGNIDNRGFETQGASPSEAANWTSPYGFNRSMTGTWGDTCGIMASAEAGSWFMRTSHTYAQTTWTVTASLIDANTSSVIVSTTVPYVTASCTDTPHKLPASPAYARRQTKIKLTHNSFGWTLTSDPFIYNGSTITFYTISDRQLGSDVSHMMIDAFEEGRNLTLGGWYNSAVHNAPLFTSWDILSVGYQAFGSSIAFFVRGSTSPFTVNSSTPSWEPITANAIPSMSSSTYFQFRSSMTFATGGTRMPQLDDFTFNWFEGNASDQIYSTFFDDAIWFSVAYGVGISSNNYVFKYDLINQGWTLYDFGAGGFAIEGNRLYFGQVGGDNIMRFGGGSTSDNGTAITAYWKSKDFPGADAFLQNEYKQVDTIWARNPNQTAAVIYSLDISTTSASYTVSLSNNTSATINNRKILPQGKLGYTVNWKFGDTSATSAWELLAFRFSFLPLTYRPSQ